MAIRRFEQIEFIPISKEKAWDFFSNPVNLALLTPAKMMFQNVFKPDSEYVYPGMCVVHSVVPFAGIRITWVTRIIAVEPGLRFVDTQLKGPFALWHHIHEFKAVAGGTEMKDVLYYSMPLGFLGDLAHLLFAEKQIQNIFQYRSERLMDIFKF